ncbi:hypothetical protein [Nocardioides nanhaiensis]|uniref:Uncharacterized protein n=1 Tax=Nocardioides nanhaiensis TaxID=1476871 RepID=A0ABP8W4W1_9ACTN
MNQQPNEIAVDPSRVIAALREQVAQLSVNLAMQTARAEQAEAAIAEQAEG